METDFRVTLYPPDAPPEVHVLATMIYDPADPYALRLRVVGLKDRVFGRDLILQALSDRTLRGEGDVLVAAYPNGPNVNLVHIQIGEAPEWVTLEFQRFELDGFITSVYSAVLPGSEGEACSGELDTFLTALLRDAA